ncbi:MAG: AsmA family protein, partial [Burkholderiales bacterium]
IKIDDANVHAKVNISGYSSPAVQFDVEADRLNFDRLDLDRNRSVERAAKPAPAHGGPKSDGAKGGGATTSPGTPIDLGALKTLNANGTLRVGAVTVAGLHAENVRASVKAAGGRVDVNPLAANLYQGTLAGSLAINAHSNAYASKQQLAGVAVGPLLRDLAGKDLLEGRGTVVLDVTTTGATVAALKHGLAGNANVHLRDGAIKGINLAEIARKASALRSGGVESIETVKTEKTDFTEMTASFQLRGGVAQSDDLAMKSPFLRLGGAGVIDIGSGSIDYTVKATVVGTAIGQEGKSGQQGKPVADTRGVTIPVRVTGALEAPKYQIDFRSMLTDAARDEVRKRVEEALNDKLDERLKGRIGEGIRGLFGR